MITSFGQHPARALQACTLLLGGFLHCHAAFAQDAFPAGPIKLVVAFPPGATTDTVGRLVSQRLAGGFNTSSFVENRGGANGNIGADYVAKSKADGQTLLVTTSSIVLSKAFGEPLAYDLVQDLLPVSLVASVPQVLAVHPSVPADTLSAFIAHAKANPDKLAYGSSGTGNITHLGVLLFMQMHGLSAVHVPYKGAAAQLGDLLAGRVQFALPTLGPALPMLKDRRLKALAVTSAQRAAALPGVPSMSEAGMAGFELGSWFGVLAPARTPLAVVRRINSEIAKGLQEPDFRARLAQEGTEPMKLSAEECAAYLKSELERWSKVIRSANVKLE